MKSKKHLLPVMLLAFILLFAFSTPALADDLDDLAYPQRPDGETTSMEYVASYILQSIGMSASSLGVYPRDHIAMANSVGLLEGIVFDPKAECGFEDFAKMTANARPLFEALRAKPLTPFFVNGMAQPIFPYGNSKYFDTSGEGVIRFIVYVESDLDTDGDGKLDLVKSLVQLPRAALDGSQFSTIFEARPYIEGTNGQSVGAALQTAGNEYLDANPGFNHQSLYVVAPPRFPAGEATTAEMADTANFREWYYRYSGSSTGATITDGNLSNESIYEDLNWYDYYLVRGFAVVLSSGIGSAGSEGYSTCGADVEINGFKAVIEWLTGVRKAYTNKTDNIEIKADWSNGNVGMTGRSYAGTTQFGLATTGVEGLKTIVPVAGIASWYEYTNSQGIANSIPYTVGLAWHCNSRLASLDWNTVVNRYMGYSQLMRREETALVGDYGEHWAHRDYTVDNWFRDWGPSKIQAPMLIVHGTNDDNVRPKQSELMYEAAKKAGVTVKWLWHQGEHMTPTFPPASPNATDSTRPFTMYCGDYLYDEWLNMWFCHYLYDLDNNILDIMPEVLALNNASGEWDSFDSWEPAAKVVLDGSFSVSGAGIMPASRIMREVPGDFTEEFPIPDITGGAGGGGATPPTGGVTLTPADADDFTVINSANAPSSSTWQNFIDGPSAGSALYVLELPEDITIKGVVEINIRAAINTLGSSASEPLRMHAKLVEVAATGGVVTYYGNNAVGGTPTRVMIERDAHLIGGGAPDFNLVEFQSRTGTYREIAKGWMDLCNPKAVYDSHTADRNDRIIARDNLDVFYNYSLYLQPTVHTAKAGNKLALLITTGGTNAAAYTGNNAFTFTIDNSATYANIPVAKAPTAITINFPGVEDVSVQYYSAAEGWATLPGTFNNTCVFLPPEDIKITSVRAVKEGMSYQFDGLTVGEGFLYLNVPVVKLMAFGIADECDIGVIQDNWVYSAAPALVGAPNYFNVFDNGKNYTVQIKRAGFYAIDVTAAQNDDYYASHGASMWAYFNNFYKVEVPAGVSDVWISSNGWAILGATAGDLITLLMDPDNIRDAKLSYVYGGKSYEKDFKLDGSDPFAGLAADNITINFPGIKDAQVRYYTNISGWQTVGAFDDVCGFDIPDQHQATWGNTTVQVLKGGMWYTFSDLYVSETPLVLNVPLSKITLTGIGADCNLGLAQEDWIYRAAPAAAGETVEYLVFDNNKPYIVHLIKPGLPTTLIPGIAAGATVDLATYF